MARSVDTPIQLPCLDMRSRLPGRDRVDGRQCFQLDELVVTITFGGASKIKILCLWVVFSTFYKQHPIPPVCQPAARVWESNLEWRIQFRIQENVVLSPAYIWIDHIRIGP